VKYLYLTVILFLMAVSVMAQHTDKAILENAHTATLLGAQPAKSPFSLLDFSRMKWSHSYTLSYLSGGGYSGSVGILNNNLFYEFSSKLSMNLNLGIMHHAGAIWGDENNNATLLPGFLLDYHPSDKFSVAFGIQRVNGYYPYYPGNRFYNSGWYRPWPY